MGFSEKIKALKERKQSLIKADSSAEDIQAINDEIAEYDELENLYNSVVTENSKFKDTIVRMVTSEGDGKAPKDASSGSKTMSIEEAVAEVQNNGGK